jgi:hypothetical protein
MTDGFAMVSATEPSEAHGGRRVASVFVGGWMALVGLIDDLRA